MSLSSELQIGLVGGFVLVLIAFVAVLLFLLQRRGEMTATMMRETAVSSAKIAEQLNILDQQKNYIRATLDTALDAIVMMDHKGCITEFNPAAEMIFGYQRREVMGQRLADVMVPEEYREAHQKGMERYQKTGHKKVIDSRIEIEAVTKAGQRLTIDLAITEWRAQEHPVYIGFMRDITDQKKADLALQAALDEARQASVEKSRFLAMMSHEIRTPINGVLGVLGLLEDAKLTRDQQRLLQTGASSANLLLDVVNDILDFSKIEAEKMELENSHFLLNEVVRPILDLMRVRITDKPLTIFEDIGPDVPECLYGDAGRIRQVLLNLVSNATKFTLEGEIAVRLSTSTDDKDQQWLRVMVTDTGIGIPADKLNSLFREFATVDPSYARKFGGSGLGLAIAKGLVELMQGQIGCDSIEGTGSTFWFDIPLVQGDMEKIYPDSNADGIDDTDMPMATKSARILLAEDNPANRMVVKTMVEKAGYRVNTVVDGREAVEAVQHLDYDLVLMDISMPGVDGIEASRAIRALPGQKSTIPIIAMTAHPIETVRDDYVNAGMNDYLPKPGRRAQILQKIDHWLTGESETTSMSKDVVAAETSSLIDREALEMLAEDTDHNLIPRMVAGFIEDAENRLQRMQEAIKKDDFGELELSSHALASSAATFGVSEGHFIARRVEAASMLENAEVCEKELTLLEENLRQSIQALKQMMLTWETTAPAS